MTALALALAAAGLLTAGSRASPVAGAAPARHAAARSRPAARRSARLRIDGSTRPRIAAGGLGIATALLLGGPAGLVAGVAVAVATGRIVQRLEPALGRRQRKHREAELPVTLDLLSVCLRAGMPLVAALETVAGALPGPFREDLRIVARLQRLGAAPSTAWAEVGNDPDLAPVARAVARSAESGSRLAAAFDRLAADRRSALASAGLARARTAGVVAMAPLGLCFLPAFVCLGIVPIVLSLAAEVLP